MKKKNKIIKYPGLPVTATVPVKLLRDMKKYHRMKQKTTLAWAKKSFG